MAQSKGGGIALDHYSDTIAFERVLIFAEEVVRDTINRAEALRTAQVTGYELDEYIKQVNGVLKDLQALNMENLQRISAEHQVIEFLMKTDQFTRDKERGRLNEAEDDVSTPSLPFHRGIPNVPRVAPVRHQRAFRHCNPHLWRRRSPCEGLQCSFHVHLRQ